MYSSREKLVKDVELRELSSVILKGWLINREDVPPSLKQHWSYRDELACLDGLLFQGDKLIVPKTPQSEMLGEESSDSFGYCEVQMQGKTVLFWPGMSIQIEENVEAYRLHTEHSRANRKEPLILTATQDQPWVKVGADLHELNNNRYKIIVDYFSKWPEISKLDNLTAKNVMSYMKSQNSRYGIPGDRRQQSAVRLC